MRESLESGARRFEFFQAARLLCRLAQGHVGVGDDPQREAVRFRGDTSLAFPRSDVVSIRWSDDAGDPPELVLAFFASHTQASYGSLPLPYSLEILDQARGKSSVLREFLDCFDHRMISLYFRAFAKYQPAVAVELGSHDFFAGTLRGLLGIATKGLNERLDLPDSALFSRAGLLGRSPVSSSSLEQLIESYFRVPARVEQFLPTWYDLAPEDRSRLGHSYATLGEDLAVGDRVQLHQFRFRVRVGSMRLADYEELLPSGQGFRSLFDLIRFATLPEQTFEVQLVLAKEDVPPFTLSAEGGCRLGWTTWLWADARERDADDSIFAFEVSAAGRPARRGPVPGTLEEAA